MSEPQGNYRPKVMVIGIDGATFDLIKPWAEQGRLPNFKSLLDSGIHGELRSTVPPVTAPAWTSFMTGKNPGKHGLFHFIEPQPGSYEIRYTNARSRLAKTIWQILGESGLRVGVMNVPMTYPPEPVNGFMISGMDAPEGSTAITYPTELYQEIKEKFGKVSPQVRYLGYLNTNARRDDVLRSLETMDEHYLALTTYLLDRSPVDVMMVVFTSVDTVQHFFWQYMDRQHPQYDAAGAAKYQDAIFQVHKRIDDIIGTLKDGLPAGTSFVLMSDHGFAASSGRVIHLNRYLHELGLLKLHQSKSSGYHPVRLFDFAVRKLDALLRGTLTSEQKARLGHWFPRLRRRWESRLSGLTSIAWRDTKAFAYEVLTFPSGIWVNLKGTRPYGTVNPGLEYERLVKFITDKLSELEDPVTGTKLIKQVYRKEEIYHGPYLDHAPDLTLAWWEGTPLLGKASFAEGVDGNVVKYLGGRPIQAGEWAGVHSNKGIVVLAGKAFREKASLEGAEITDLAPTLLYLLGFPLPADMDGRVLSEAFTAEFASSHEVLRHRVADYEPSPDLADSTYSEEESEKVMQRLRGLGYIE